MDWAKTIPNIFLTLYFLLFDFSTPIQHWGFCVSYCQIERKQIFFKQNSSCGFHFPHCNRWAVELITLHQSVQTACNMSYNQTHPYSFFSPNPSTYFTIIQVTVSFGFITKGILVISLSCQTHDPKSFFKGKWLNPNKKNLKLLKQQRKELFRVGYDNHLHASVLEEMGLH